MTNTFVGATTAGINAFVGSTSDTAFTAVLKTTANVIDDDVYDISLDSLDWRAGASSTIGQTLPKINGLVLEAALLSDFDITASAASLFKTWVLVGATSVDALNGVIVIGTSSGIVTIDLEKDEVRRRNTTGNQLADQDVASFNMSTVTWGTANGDGIVNDTVNDVAITALSGAEIDGSSSLPFPTIEAMTAAGSSWVNHEGSLSNVNDVTDGTGAIALVTGDIDASGLCVMASATDVYIFESVPAIDTALASADFIMNTSATTGPTVTGTITSVEISSATSFIIGTSVGVFIVDYVIGSGGDSVATQITKDFNSGSKPGDIRLAALSDSTAESIGGELVTNGDFASDTAWTKGTGWTIAAGVATKAAGTPSELTQAVSFVTGKTYAITYTVTSFTAGQIQIRLSASGGVPFGLGTVRAATGTFTEYFTAESGQNQLEFVTTGTSDLSIDNVSIVIAVEDRSVKSNDLSVNGTLTKAAVETGAELMAYSGFSASNFLDRAADTDFDFGTGDLCAAIWFKSTSTALQYQFERSVVGGVRMFECFLTATTGLANFKIATDTTLTSSAAYNDGEWHLLIGLRRGTTSELWIDGVLVDTDGSTASTTNATAVLGVGARAFSAGTFPWGGSLSLMRLTAYAPTAAQILKMYNDEKVLFVANANALLDGTSNAVSSVSVSQGLIDVGT
ncbi:MAG: hypothetical protein COB09_17155, partial [Thalassobium sp.]